jgi:nucleoside-diphosphate-sugar epimerase
MPDSSSDFYDCDYLIISISTKDNYLNTLKNIALHVRDKTTVILLSSISVYREFECEVDENIHISKIALQYEAETLMQNMIDKLIILRLGGLMGDSRIAGRWSKISSFSEGYVNYVHIDDVIGVIKMLIENNFQKELLNVVAPIHPLRSEVHFSNSEKFGFKLGTFKGMTHRVVKSNKLIEKLGYKFLYPNPLEFW